MTNLRLRDLALLALLCLLPRASALTYQFTFTQAGYDSGAYVESALFLSDLNDDGMISDDGPLGDSIGGHMRLIGHPTYSGLIVTFYGGWFDLQTMQFLAHGDTPYTLDPRRLIDGFITPSAGGFSNLPGEIALLSTQPVILRRVPESLPLSVSVIPILAILFHRRRVLMRAGA